MPKYHDDAREAFSYIKRYATISDIKLVGDWIQFPKGTPIDVLIMTTGLNKREKAALALLIQQAQTGKESV